MPQVRKIPARRTADHRTRIGRERRARTRQRIIEAALGVFDDPVRRVATGMRLWLHLSRQDPVFCAFVVRIFLRALRVDERQIDALLAVPVPVSWSSKRETPRGRGVVRRL